MKTRRQHHIQSRRTRKRPTSKPSTALATTAPRPIIRWNGRELSQEQVDLLKRTVCKEATDDQFALFMNLANRGGFDPFARQIYAVFYHNEKSRRGEGPKDMVLIVGIDGYRMAAARDHKDFGGSSSAKFTYADPPKKTSTGKMIPESATITVYRKGGMSAEVTVYFEEYAPADLTTEKAKFWRVMPKVMLEKCAEAKALRKCFPGLGPYYIREEMAQRDELQTDSGREITDTNGINAQGTPVTPQARFQLGRERAQAVAEQKIDNLTSGAEHAASKIDERRAKEKPRPEAEKPAIDVQPTAAAKEPRIVELDLSIATDPIIRGEIGEIMEALQKYCTMTRGQDSWWHCQPKDVDTIIAFLDHCNEKIGDGRPFKVRRIQNSPATPRGDKESPTKRAAGGESKRGTSTAEPTLVKGILIRCDAAMVREGRTPVRQIKVDSTFYSSFRNTIFTFLDQGIGKACELWIDRRKQVVGIKRIGSLEFDADGATPIVSRDREAGGKTLF